MKKILFVIFSASILSFSTAYAREIHDWEDLEKVHEHINAAIHEMERAQKANHYDMGGHATEAEKALRLAERELEVAIESAKKAK